MAVTTHQQRNHFKQCIVAFQEITTWKIEAVKVDYYAEQREGDYYQANIKSVCSSIYKQVFYSTENAKTTITHEM